MKIERDNCRSFRQLASHAALAYSLVMRRPIVGSMRPISTVVLAIAVLSSAARAQQKPDFSGVWELDPARSDDRGVYGQLRVITQTPTQIDMAVLHFASRTTSIIPWDLPLDRWRPRRGGDQSLEPIVQSRWDGNRLVTLKAPGTHYSVLWIWNLSDDGMTLTVDVISTQISPSFDFKAASAPRGFIPNRHVYSRVVSPNERTFMLGEALLRFGRDAGTIEVTCATPSCTLIDVVNGRRGQRRRLDSGREATISLRANTLISASRD
jgi:hypothetical protein